jgi:hypothetical protein
VLVSGVLVLFSSRNGSIVCPRTTAVHHQEPVQGEQQGPLGDKVQSHELVTKKKLILPGKKNRSHDV